MLADLPCEAADQASEIYDQLERDLVEAAALEEHVERPSDELAYARIRSAEISRTGVEDSLGANKTDSESDSPHEGLDAVDLDFSDISPKPAA